MLENSKTEVQSSHDGSSVESGLARRRLIRAGLAATPVMFGLTSQSALANDVCIKPSAFSSLKAANMKLSHKPNQGWTCFSHGYWKNHSHPAPYSDKTKSFFLTKLLGPGEVTAGFTSNPGNEYTGKTLQQVLEMNGNANDTTALARHVVGTFLTAVANGDDSTKVLLTTWQCKQIWDNQGNWSPVAGQTWTMANWLEYFDYVYGGT
ncbi:MAG: hypothetical protein Q7T10_19095 [Rhodoferax sp.]|uniref:hypothetical protein n=1 Tax=Rhodoferax sp. TaxID=50421 RepID=UPI002719C4AA|nr:hypothetical protein [Rhodoferax sp.]MDO8450905.1 hypothetical protein [Rhodoferax sp.]